MNRARFLSAATLLGASLAAAGTALAQTAPPMTPILGNKKFVAPVKGPADVEYTKPISKREKDMVITRITVKNIGPAPIARMTIAETWFDKANNPVAGGKGFINGLLQPGEIQTIEIQTPYNTKMNGNSWNFSHANGDVKPHRVDKLVPAGEAAPATASKAPVAKAPAKK